MDYNSVPNEKYSNKSNVYFESLYRTKTGDIPVPKGV